MSPSQILPSLTISNQDSRENKKERDSLGVGERFKLASWNEFGIGNREKEIKPSKCETQRE
jgi:hypothetical protein